VIDTEAVTLAGNIPHIARMNSRRRSGGLLFLFIFNAGKDRFPVLNLQNRAQSRAEIVECSS
jgi:hypothetical protein